MRPYGDSTDDSLLLAQQALPIVQQLLLPTDAIERAGVIEARIANYRKMKKKFPLAALFYDNEIAKLQARLGASKRQTDLQFEQERSRRIFRYLGWAAGGVGVLVGIALITKLVRK